MIYIIDQSFSQGCPTEVLRPSRALPGPRRHFKNKLFKNFHFVILTTFAIPTPIWVVILGRNAQPYNDIWRDNQETLYGYQFWGQAWRYPPATEQWTRIYQ